MFARFSIRIVLGVDLRFVCGRKRARAAAVETPVPQRYMAAHMTKMFKIALPDGSVKEMPEGSTPADVAAAIGPGLAKAALAAQDQWRGARHHAPVRGRREPRADHLARRGRGARAGPPRLRAYPRRGGAEPLPRNADHLRPGDRRRLLLRFRAGARARPLHRGGAAARSRRRCGASSPPTSRWSARCGPASRCATSSRSRARRSRPNG